MIPIPNRPEIQIYDSIETLPLWNWDKYSANRDLEFLRVGYTGREKKSPESEMILLRKAEETILEEYFTALNDRSFEAKLQKYAKINVLETKYNACSMLLSVMWGGFPNTDAGQEMRYKYIMLLKEFRYNMPIINSELGDLEEISRINNDLQGIKNQIALLHADLKQDGQKERLSLYKQIAIAKTALPGYEMNPKVMVLAEWIEIGRLLEEKAKQN